MTLKLSQNKIILILFFKIFLTYSQNKHFKPKLILFKTETCCESCYEELIRVINKDKFDLFFYIQTISKSNFEYQKATLKKKYLGLNNYKFKFYKKDKKYIFKEDYFNYFNIYKTPSLLIKNHNSFWTPDQMFNENGLNKLLIEKLNQ